jgi:hypothetical protein
MRGIFLGRLNAARNRLSDLPKGPITFFTFVVSVFLSRKNSEGRLLRSKYLKSFLRYLQNIFAL